MKLLIIGGAGYVGSIVRETLESRFECTHLDRVAIPGTRGRMIVGDVGDDAAVAGAVAGQDALLYMAMGVAPEPTPKGRKNVNALDPAFAVNVRDLYRVVAAGLDAGVRRFVYTSSLSVYHRLRRDTPVDEDVPPDSWTPYGVTKRLGEAVCAAAAQHAPEASVLALRLIQPKNEADWPAVRYDPAGAKNVLALGPGDTRRLFLAALGFHAPGFHVVQASGDMAGDHLPTDRVRALLGWSPRNE